MDNILKQKKNHFIELKKENLPISFYLIRKSLLKAVNSLKPRLKGKVLDLACGIMPYKEYLQNDLITDYFGIDLEPTEYHNTVKPDFYWNGKDIPFEDETFDFIIATEFLEHYFDTELILKEIKRVLKPGGVFFFTVPSVWPIHEAPYDYHRFTPFSLEEHFRRRTFSNWEILPLGGYNYQLALSLALWYDNRLNKKFKSILRPFINIFIDFLIRKDNIKKSFDNGFFYSGLYGFVTK